MKNNLIVVIGSYGSGKSEYAINIARLAKKDNENVALVDLDVVNPYFRSRDVKEEFSGLGVEVISPDGEFGHADLPMISPRILGAVKTKEKTVILDVGGDPAGCRTLGRFVTEIKKRGYEMHFVVNTLRPFTSTVEEIQTMIKMLETASGLKITELIANVNLMEQTTNEIVREGIDILDQTARSSSIPFNRYLVIQPNDKLIENNILGKEKVVIDYYLKKPWETVRQLGI